MLNRGYSLLEMLVSLLLTGLLVSGVMMFHLTLKQNYLKASSQLFLDNQLRALLSTMAKEIRRAGFHLDETTEGASVMIAHAGRCFTLDYNSSHDTSEPPQHIAAELITRTVKSYRYADHNIELKLSERCDGSGWRKLFDPHEVQITEFSISKQAHYYQVILAGVLMQQPVIKQQFTWLVKSENE